MELNDIPPSSRLLEGQMQEQERVHSEKYKMLVEELNKLKEEKQQEQKLLAQSLLLPADARVEASLKHEITRLTKENLVSMVSVCQCLLLCLLLVVIFKEYLSTLDQYLVFKLFLVFFSSVLKVSAVKGLFALALTKFACMILGTLGATGKTRRNHTKA